MKPAEKKSERSLSFYEKLLSSKTGEGDEPMKPLEMLHLRFYMYP